ncbi:MAG: glycosyltransferase family A protein [Phormidesmis sp.]
MQAEKHLKVESSPFVSVIVPVFNDAKRLRLCLGALMQQTYERDCYEIVVIDNGSDAQQDIAAVVANFAQAKYEYEAQPGSYAARNRGIERAQGDILAFTDADCIPATDWLEKGVGHLLSIPDCGLVAGSIELFFRGPKLSPVELYESITAFPQQLNLARYRGAATANIFTFKSVIDSVGTFNASLLSSGDIDWGERVFAAGYQQLYAEDTCVAHPARYSFEQLHQKTLRVTGGIFGRFVRPEHTALRQNMTFARLLADDFMQSVSFINNAFKDKRLVGFEQKITVSLVVIWVRCVNVTEKVRLKFGGVPHRE